MTATPCAHVADLPATPDPGSPSACPSCIEEGLTHWVHLRMCLTCGKVGCCDSSVARHATRHHEATGHPVMRSVEPGEDWRWCYVDLRLV